MTAMNKPLNFQSMILALQTYWAEQNCLIWQPYYSQVGAGTMNPATFLRVLGPEPWNVAYVEPSVRPDDGRYGNNPNRLQRHYQFQVILKPDPGNPQELYLGSLEAIGIDPKQHDIRFVEDNWESPALGAWGLGWEVWLDGLEITQFTYFQQAGQLEVNPVAVEITYGLDRIATPLQKVHGFQNIQWSDNVSFGDVNLQGEQEHSKYYFEVADVDRNRKIYDLTQEELQNALDADLILPAYDHLLKLSHLFNVLDTRGAIGVTERQQFFKTMRTNAGKIAKMYVASRENQEYPWLTGAMPADTKTKSKPVKFVLDSKITFPDTSEDFVLEIGTEEIPAADLEKYIVQLENAFPIFLDENYLSYDEINVVATPRRMVVHVSSLIAKQANREDLVKGPPANRAFEADGETWSKAALGFARGKGIKESDLSIGEIEGGSYVVATIKKTGLPTTHVLTEKLPKLLSSLKVDRTMRWNNSNITFSRPIRWFFAVHGEHLVPFTFAGITASKQIRGLRFQETEYQVINSTKDYFAALKKEGIQLDHVVRKENIKLQIEALAKSVGGEIKEDDELLQEITHLVEAPYAILGTFEEAHLSLPPEVLVTVMKKHQRYFPIYKDGSLLPNFITVRNGNEQHADIVAKGNEAVVKARFADAAFFVEEDRKQKLEEYLPRLDTLTFQFKLGSMLDKSQRIKKIVSELAPTLNLPTDDLAIAERAADLCKADLATSMVVEMTSLQGVIGMNYALSSGEDDAVALAIYEHYLPRTASDDNASSAAGFAVGLADRIDSLVGLFAAGLAPTGTKDPFAQRRSALGLVQSLIGWNQAFDIKQALSAASNHLPIDCSEEVINACYEFVLGRMKNTFLDQGYRFDVVDAVLSELGHNPAAAKIAIEQLSTWINKESWESILPAYSRCVRITRDKANLFTVDPSTFVEDIDSKLYEGILTIESEMAKNHSIDVFLNNFLSFVPTINLFFEDVMVMTEDKKERENRLGMLQRIAKLSDGIADFSKLEGF
jgi:glycyl-tRNA synthetase